MTHEQDEKLINCLAVMVGKPNKVRFEILRRCVQEIIDENGATSDLMIADLRAWIQGRVVKRKKACSIHLLERAA